MLSIYFKSFIKNTPKMLLGRWSVKNKNKMKEDITVFWANSDHCGDAICGNPKENTKILEKNIKSASK